jgi:predicted nucleic acid-binding protein
VTLIDTSVVVAAFASWHAQHRAADSVIDGKARLVAHCAIEAFSVLTRLPPPHRVAGDLVRDFLAARFPDPYVALDAPAYGTLIPRLVQLGISGGATYDALVAATARAARETLVSCDRRAAQTYERVGVEFRLLD